MKTTLDQNSYNTLHKSTRRDILKRAGIVASLCFLLGGFPEISAQTKSPKNIDTEEMNANQQDTINFDTGMFNIENTEPGAIIDSTIARYRNKYFQYFDKLSKKEKIDYIYGILKESVVIKNGVDRMLDDEDIIEAIKLGDKDTIEKEFLRNIGFRLCSHGLGLLILFAARRIKK